VSRPRNDRPKRRELADLSRKLDGRHPRWRVRWQSIASKRSFVERTQVNLAAP
jgi:hypothetical protein